MASTDESSASESWDPVFEVPAGFVDRLFRLDGRVAAVTGGGSGLGAAMAKGLAQAGAALAVLDVNDDGAERTVTTIRGQGGTAEALHCDVTDRRAVDEAADRVVSELGRVDVLVNSAGRAYRSPAEDFPEEEFDRIIALNLKGTYLCCQSFGRKLLAQGSGSIVNIASIGAFISYPHASAYNASKGGVLNLTRVLALEWIDRGVRVNGIAPGLCDSPLTRARARQSSVTSDFLQARMLRRELILPRELVGAAVFLASDASARVTGHTLLVDDGYTAV
jgi:NAD(P)-dependent dehydrogenase (short-subunit alcohol dehydrogenase family)